MNKFKIITLSVFGFMTALSTVAQEKMDLKNSRLEGINPQGEFYWWKNQSINGGEATYSIEDTDVNQGSKKALKVDVSALGPKPWFVSSQFNQKFKAKAGDEITVEFYGKKISDTKAKIKLVFQSDVKGSFQGKDFFLTSEWMAYSTTFIVNEKSNKNQVKFWFMEAGSSYLIDDVSVSKK